jgi:hypothetical protein
VRINDCALIQAAITQLPAATNWIRVWPLTRLANSCTTQVLLTPASPPTSQSWLEWRAECSTVRTLKIHEHLPYRIM